MKKFRFISALLIVAVLLAACGSAATATPQSSTTSKSGDWGKVTIPKGQPIKIGVASATTGETANLGIDIRRGTELAVDDKPEIKGFKVQIVAEDDLCSGEGGTAVAQKMVADTQILAVVGDMCSSSSIAASDIYEQYGVSMVSPSSTAVQFTSRGLKVTNTVSMSDADQGRAAAEYFAKNLGFKTIAVLHDGSAYGQGIATVVKQEFEKLGGKVSAFEGVTVGEKDFRAILTKIAADKPQGIYFGGFQAEASILATQRSEVGLGDAVFFTDEGCFSEIFIQSAGDAAKGAYATMAETSESQELIDFRARYQKKYGDDPKKLGPYHAHGYDAMTVIMAAIEKVAETDSNGNLVIDRAKLVDAIRQTKDFKGLTGTIGFNDHGERTGLKVLVYQVEDGKWALTK